MLANLYLTYAKLSALEEKLSSLENEVKGLERDFSNALYYSQRATDAAAGARDMLERLEVRLVIIERELKDIESELLFYRP